MLRVWYHQINVRKYCTGSGTVMYSYDFVIIQAVILSFKKGSFIFNVFKQSILNFCLSLKTQRYKISAVLRSERHLDIHTATPLHRSHATLHRYIHTDKSTLLRLNRYFYPSTTWHRYLYSYTVTSTPLHRNTVTWTPLQRDFVTLHIHSKTAIPIQRDIYTITSWHRYIYTVNTVILWLRFI